MQQLSMWEVWLGRIVALHGVDLVHGNRADPVYLCVGCEDLRGGTGVG